ncbi:hypothetical protein vBEcoMWL3_gp204 [Escherichia phage vB_EcoM_WL-3]|nr:hypothetical protein vBEcoMWL3_gp204 [Escherichia phage vB_EcoM_WL-3]
MFEITQDFKGFGFNINRCAIVFVTIIPCVSLQFKSVL